MEEMGFNDPTKKTRVVSEVVKSRQAQLPPRLQWTVLVGFRKQPKGEKI